MITTLKSNSKDISTIIESFFKKFFSSPQGIIPLLASPDISILDKVIIIIFFISFMLFIYFIFRLALKQSSEFIKMMVGGFFREVLDAISKRIDPKSIPLVVLNIVFIFIISLGLVYSLLCWNELWLGIFLTILIFAFLTCGGIYSRLIA